MTELEELQEEYCRQALQLVNLKSKYAAANNRIGVLTRLLADVARQKEEDKPAVKRWGRN